MTEEPQPEASAAEVVLTGAEAEVAAVAEAEAEAEAEKKADEAAFTADDAWEETCSFKEESNLVDDLPGPQKKALDEFKQLIAAALAAGEFNLPPPLPQPKAEEEPRNEEPAKEERKAEAEAAAEEPKAKVPADAPVEEVKTEVTEPRLKRTYGSVAYKLSSSHNHPARPANRDVSDRFYISQNQPARIDPANWAAAEEAEPSEPGAQEKAVVVVAGEEIEETFVSAPKSASEEAAAPEAVAETQAAAPEPVLIWGVPLVGDDDRTDTVLLKFLQAREFKVKEAMAMLKSAVLWRERVGISSLLDDDLGLAELENVVFYRGADREGHPVCYNVYGEFQDKELYERAFGDDEKRERFLKWRIQLLERGILSKLDFSPGGICSMVQVTDLKNSPPMLHKHSSVIRQAVTLLQDNYPEFIAKKVFINVPWWYLAAYKMMSPFLTQRTKSKFVFATQAKSAETLFRYIAPEQVPVQFGGLFKEDDPEFTTSDTVTELTIKPKSKKTVEIPVTENSIIAWELLVLGWEVTYGAEFTPDTKGGYAVIVQKTRKVPANEEPIMKGSFKAGEPGKLVLTVNNPASKKKQLLYRSKTRLAPPRPPLLCSPAIRTAGSNYSDGHTPPNKWVLDSSAWIHHTSKLELLLEAGDFQEMDNKDVPWSGDDTAAPHVQGRGSVGTQCFDFPGVHYIVGDDTRNVVSVSQLARDHGLVTVFEPTCCHVEDKKTGQIVGKGRLRNGMYMLDSLRIVVQYVGDRGASGGDRHDRADEGGGGRGHEARGNEEGDSTAEGRVGEGGTRARNQEKGTRNRSGAAGGDVNEINESQDNGEKETEEMNGNDEDEIKETEETNDKGENEEDEKRGQNFGQLSSRPYTGFFGLSRFGTSGEVESKEETWGGYPQELSPQEHNKKLFGLSRFDVTTDPSGYQLPAGAFSSSINEEERGEEFLVDSGASFHVTWREQTLFHYAQHLQDHTKPPTRSLGGIVGSIEVKRSGYLNGNKITIDGVLLAPESRMNLVSVGQLSVQYGVVVIMDHVGVVIMEQQDGVQIGEGRMLNNHLYVLERFDPPGGIFAHLHTPHPNVFGRSPPGPAQ